MLGIGSITQYALAEFPGSLPLSPSHLPVFMVGGGYDSIACKVEVIAS